jgi:hypothetical protein
MTGCWNTALAGGSFILERWLIVLVFDSQSMTGRLQNPKPDERLDVTLATPRMTGFQTDQCAYKVRRLALNSRHASLAAKPCAYALYNCT